MKEYEVSEITCKIVEASFQKAYDFLCACSGSGQISMSDVIELSRNYLNVELEIINVMCREKEVFNV